ncbi:MAG TPA: VOC family protein [Solirubrobacteraceae bacterium]|nr:VOC family protein [Solirubrobacteraceae bacterium]
MLRLRQAVLAARDLDAAVERLRDRLPLGEPFADPGVGHFGLRNAVMALGDTFVEVVSPTRPDTAAGRHLDRRGDGGYMVMFQLDALDAARERAAALGIRTVWELELSDIVDVHLHPRDMGAAIVALDRCDPPEGWRWGGPEWEGRAPASIAAGGITGATLRSPDPDALARRWGSVLGRSPEDGVIPLDLGGSLRFVTGESEGIEAFHAALPGRAGESLELGGVRFELG